MVAVSWGESGAILLQQGPIDPTSTVPQILIGMQILLRTTKIVL